MPHETCDSDTGGSPAHRRELIATTDGVDGVAGQSRVRVSNVPLFRDVDGGLADRGSFVSVENPRVEVNQLSQNIDGELIVHLESHASERVTTNVSFTGMTVTRARFASFLGTDIEEMPLRHGSVTIGIDAGALNLVRLHLGHM